MGGAGALRLAFKYPDIFAGVAVFEPDIKPSLHWHGVLSKNRFWFSDAHFETLYGKPIDADYWQDNNPASIARDNAERIKKSKLRIYIECGNEDFLALHEGTQFLHEILWKAGIQHDFHLVDGADHVDGTLRRRHREGLQFLGRVVTRPEADEARESFLRRFRNLKRHGPLPGEADVKATLNTLEELSKDN